MRRRPSSCSQPSARAGAPAVPGPRARYPGVLDRARGRAAPHTLGYPPMNRPVHQQMEYPRVKALHFKIEHDSGIDYSNAAPLALRECAFDVLVEDEKACFTMNEHHATEEETRDTVAPYISAWEFEAALQLGPNKFTLAFDVADIEDRNPTTGTVFLRPQPVRLGALRGSLNLTVAKNRYPSPPTAAVSCNPDVQSMLDRYLGYRERREPLPSIAYFCYTVLCNSHGPSSTRRSAVGRYYGIREDVLGTLSRLSSTKGGTSARKAEGIHQELTREERRFLEAVVKTIIRRAAELAADPSKAVKPITLSDLPPV